jgi:hypothetical protein
MFNLLPPELAAHLLAFLKNIIPLLGLVCIRVFLYTVIGLQKMNSILNQSLRNEDKLWRLSFQKQD